MRVGRAAGPYKQAMGRMYALVRGNRATTLDDGRRGEWNDWGALLPLPLPLPSPEEEDKVRGTWTVGWEHHRHHHHHHPSTASLPASGGHKQVASRARVQSVQRLQSHRRRTSVGDRRPTLPLGARLVCKVDGDSPEAGIRTTRGGGEVRHWARWPRS